MKVAVADANVFIDLQIIGKSDLLFQIELEIHTTAEVLSELDFETRTFLAKKESAGQLQVRVLDAEEVTAVRNEDLPRGLSHTDLSVIFISEEQECIVLIGDRLMRKILQERNIEVHGTLWLLDRFIETGNLSYAEAIQALTSLTDQNSFLPIDECQKRIKKWKRKV